MISCCSRPAHRRTAFARRSQRRATDGTGLLVPRRRQHCLVRLQRTFLGCLVAVGLLWGCTQAPEERLLHARCGRCHAVEQVLAKRKSEAAWERTIWAMRQRGADLTDAEADQLVRYLSRVRGLR